MSNLEWTDDRRTSTNLGRSHGLPTVCTTMIHGKFGGYRLQETATLYNIYNNNIILLLYIYNSQKSTSNLGPVMWIIANLGRSHHIAYRLPCVVSKKPMSVQSPIQYIFIVLPLPGIVGVVAVLK